MTFPHTTCRYIWKHMSTHSGNAEDLRKLKESSKLAFMTYMSGRAENLRFLASQVDLDIRLVGNTFLVFHKKQ